MQNIIHWEATKFILTKPDQKRWGPNPKHVYPGSWFIISVYIDLYVSTIRKFARGKLLDLGAGAVPFYGIYKDQIEENICIDWANSMHHNPYLDIVADLNQAFPIPDNSFDSILCSDVLERIANPAAFMSETARVLKPGGHLMLMVPFFYWLHETPFDYFRYTEFALRKFCEDHKLEVVELQPYGGYLEVLLDLINKGFGKKRGLAKGVYTLSKYIIRLKFAQRIRRKTAERFPLGYCLVARKS